MATKISDIENINLIHEHGLDYNGNQIYITGVVDYIAGTGVEETEQPGVEFIMATRMIKNLHILQEKTEESITIHLKTNGGHWTQGISMFDAIKASSNHIKIINYAEARSMSSLIFLAGDEQVMHKHSKFMFHTGTIHTGGTTKQFRTEYQENEKAMEQMLDIYVEHLFGKPYWVNKSKHQIRNWLIKQMDAKEEVYLSADEAVEIGFADRIIENY